MNESRQQNVEAESRDDDRDDAADDRSARARFGDGGYWFNISQSLIIKGGPKPIVASISLPTASADRFTSWLLITMTSCLD